MKKHLLLFPVLFITLSSWAQLVPTCPPGQNPAENCDEACVYCDVNGYQGSTVGYHGTYTVTCGCIFVDNDQWLAFVAGDTMADFTASCMGCVNMNGVQFAIYENCNSEPIQCECGKQGGQGVPLTLENIPLSPGTTYYLMIDGWTGDKCSFKLSVDPPDAAKAYPIGSTIGPIQGPDIICPGAIATYSVPPVANAGAYTWTAPPGWKINGQNSPQHLYAVDGGNKVKIKVGSTGGTICVSASNSCYPDGPDTCKTIIVGNTPVNMLPKVYVCPEAVPYTLPWGQQVSTAGNYQKTLKSIYNCDSTVSQEVIIRTPVDITLAPVAICAGDSLWLCGKTYTQTGSYIHHCTAYTGCDSTIHVDLTVLAPNAKIIGAGVLTCATQQIQLNAAISPAGTAFEWQNGSGQMLGTGPQLTVSTPGIYHLKAMMQSGAVQCIQTDTVVIQADTIVPGVTAAGGTLNCTQTTIMLQADSDAASPEWSWSGPGGFFSTNAQPSVTQPGVYNLSVKNQLNGCSASTSTEVLIDTIRPLLALSSGVLTCSNTSTTLQAVVTPIAVDYLWSGPNGFSAALPSPTVFIPGTYILLATNPINHCSTLDSVPVLLDDQPPGAMASVSGEISCNTLSIAISGTSNTIGATFHWVGPGNFSSAFPNPVVDTAGNYLLTVTGPNGCTGSTSAQVTGNTEIPSVGASGGTLFCHTPSLMLQGNSGTAGVIYQWVGPNNFQSALQNPIVSDTGLYLLTVIAPNACTAGATAQVHGDFLAPDLFAATDTITCRDTTVLLIAESATPGVSFEWNGPGGFFSLLDTALTAQNGLYQLTAIAPNGCLKQISLNVPIDIVAPGAAAQGDTLTCTKTTLILNGSTNTPEVEWLWTGPGGFHASTQFPLIQQTGIYQLQVTDELNGCTSNTTIFIPADTIPPIVAASTGTLTCSEDTLLLEATSDLSADFQWSGPGGFTYTGGTPAVSLQGVYTLVAQAIVNGCADTIAVTVQQDITPPDATAQDDTLDCALTQIALNGISATPGAQFSWSGPNNFSATGPNPLVSEPGSYLLTVTGPNGCQNSATSTILQDLSAPQVTLSGGDTLNCAIGHLWLTATINTAGTSGVWSGPGNFFATDTLINISLSGAYTFLATAPNGCVSTRAHTVYADSLPPQAEFAQGGMLDCHTQSLSLQAGAATPVSYQWSGPQGFVSSQPSPLVTIPGDYVVVLSNLSNACTATALATVSQDTLAPDISAQSDTLTCSVQVLHIEASSGVSPTSYVWTGPGNFTATEEDPLVSAPGVYHVTITGPNGCTSELQHLVTQNIVAPDAVTIGDTLSCLKPSGILKAGSATPGVQYSWSGPNNFSAAGPEVPVDDGGMYQVTVLAPNGCSTTKAAWVQEDTLPPVLTATGGLLTCLNPLVTMSASSDKPVTWLWSGPGNFSSALPAPETGLAGLYLASATAENGCIATVQVLVQDHTQAPKVEISAPDSLHCNVLQVNLVATVAAGGAFTIQWSTTDGNILSGVNNSVAVANQAGTYNALVTEVSNGCSATASATVLLGHALPTGAELLRRHISCYGKTEGSAQVLSIAGGTAPYSYAVDNQDFSAETGYEHLSAGEHLLWVKDANGCLYHESFEILELEDLTLELGPDTSIQLGQSIELSLESCINYPDRVAEIRISPHDLDFPTLLRPLHSFRYRVSITDSSGCTVEDSRSIYVEKPRKVYIPNVFNPDSGNNNLLYVFAGADVQLIRQFAIFDRWGDQVFQQKDFLPNDPSRGWDGRFLDVPMAPAVFVYYVEVLFIDGEVRVFEGDVTLVR